MDKQIVGYLQNGIQVNSKKKVAIHVVPWMLSYSKTYDG